MGHRDMGDAALAEKRTLALMGAVNELIDEHEHAGSKLLAERTARRERNQVGDPCPLQYVDIGAIIDIGRRQNMSLAMPRQKYDRQPGDHAVAERSRGFTPRA